MINVTKEVRLHIIGDLESNGHNLKEAIEDMIDQLIFRADLYVEHGEPYDHSYEVHILRLVLECKGNRRKIKKLLKIKKK